MSGQQPDLWAATEQALAQHFTMPGDSLDAEMWLAARMRQHGVHAVFEGLTDRDVRKARFRQHIVEGGLQLVMACHAEDGRKAENYSQAFERIYGEPLELDVVKRRRKHATPGATLTGGDSATSASESSRPSEQRQDFDDDSIAF